MTRGAACNQEVIAGMPPNRKGGRAMINLMYGHSVESGEVADITGYMPVSGVAARNQRQEARYKLRGSLRRITSLKRLRSCGLPLGGDMIVRSKEGVHHYAGHSTCGSGWICPVCAAKIRYHRAHE